MPGSSPPLRTVLERFDRLVEVGIGERTAVAAGLAERGVRVTGTDVRERTVPEGVTFVLDDVTNPDRSVYTAADAIYALRLPPELQGPTASLAESVGVALYFTTLGGDPVLVEADQRTAREGTLFVRRPGRPGPGSR